MRVKSTLSLQIKGNYFKITKFRTKWQIKTTLQDKTYIVDNYFTETLQDLIDELSDSEFLKEITDAGEKTIAENNIENAQNIIIHLSVL